MSLGKPSGKTKAFMKKVCVTALSATLLLTTTPAYAWNDDGHRLTLALAFQFKPELRKKMAKAMRMLPQSTAYRGLVSGGYRAGSDAKKEQEYLRLLFSDVTYAAIFPDEIKTLFRSAGSYNADHYVNLPYESTSESDSLVGGRAFAVWESHINNLKGRNEGNKAWSLAWVIHIAGDLHNPLHSVARKHPYEGTDKGGNLYRVDGKALRGSDNERNNVHAYWDGLLRLKRGDVETTASKLYTEHYKKLNKDNQQKFNAKRKALTPKEWAYESREIIQSLGYPFDNKVSDYRSRAVNTAEKQAVLCGARLADLLSKYL